MSTVQNIVESAQRKCGRGDTSNSTIQAEALRAFNNMIKSWTEIYRHAPVDESFSLVVGTASYTIGSGGTINSARPTKILSCYIRDSSSVDYPVSVTMSKQEFDNIAQKGSDIRPTSLYYAPENPLGIIYFDSEPEAVETCYISSYKPYSVYAALTDTILEPVEYEEAFIYNLAISLAPEYGVTLDQNVIAMAVMLKNDILQRNASVIPIATFDSALLR